MTKIFVPISIYQRYEAFGRVFHLEKVGEIWPKIIISDETRKKLLEDLNEAAKADKTNLENNLNKGSERKG